VSKRLPPLLAALLLLALWAAGSGAVAVPAWDTLRILTGRLLGMPELLEGVPAVSAALVWEVRLPRLVTAAGSMSL